MTRQTADNHSKTIISVAVGERESQTGERVLGVGKAQGADYTVHILPGGGKGGTELQAKLGGRWMGKEEAGARGGKEGQSWLFQHRGQRW